MLEQIGISEQYFGIIFAFASIIAGISAKNQNKIHNKFRNKTLAILAIPTSVTCILVGLFMLGNFSKMSNIIFILAMFLIQYITKGPANTLIRRYLNNFTTSSLRDKITSSYNLIESIARATISLIASIILRITNVSGALLVIGCLITIVFVLLLDKMRGKVGLKPEEYNKKEIEFFELK